MRKPFQTIEHLESRQLLAAGDVDSSFSNGVVRGEYMYPPTIGYLDFNAVGSLVAPDGSVFVYGDEFVAKFLRNGALDAKFGRAGVTKFMGIGVSDLTAALDSRGRVVLAGRGIESEPTLNVVRLLANGEFDASFATNGMWTTSALTVVSPVSLTIDLADRPIVGFSVRSGDRQSQIQFQRLTQDGNIDRRFGQRGAVNLDFFPGPESISSLHIGPDGKAAFLVNSEKDLAITVAKLNTRGELDKTFDRNGIAAVSFDSVIELSSERLITLPNGRLAAVARASSLVENGSYRTEVVVAARFLPDGEVDREFGRGDGIAASNEWFPNDQELFTPLYVASIAVTSDGLLNLFGDWVVGDKFVQIKIRGNGTVSNNFGHNGVRALDVSQKAFRNFVDDPVRLRSDDSISVVLTEEDGDYYQNNDFEVISVASNGSRDEAFDGIDAGRVFTPHSYTESTVLVDGRLLVSAHRSRGVNFYSIEEDGSLDDGFGDSGRVIEGDIAAAVLIPLSSGGFVRWGPSNDPSDGDSIAVSISRHNSNGIDVGIAPAEGYQEFFISDDTGGGIVTLLPRGWVSITYEVLPHDRRFGLLINPAGQAVDTPFEIPRGGEYGDYPENDALVGVLPGPGGSVYGFGQEPIYQNDVQVVRDVILRAGGDDTLPAFGVDDTVFNVSGVIASDLQGRILYRTRSGIRRLNLDGSRDMSFGNKGTASVVAGYDHLDIDSKGRLIAWRVIQGGAADGDIQVMRLTPNGKLDATFGGGDGVAVVDTRFSSTAESNVIITPDDKLVVTAMRQESTRVRWSATRLLG